MAFPGLIDLLFITVGLKVLAMIVFDFVTKVLDTEKLPQQTIDYLNCDIIFIVFFRREKPLRKQTQTPSPPPHHTHTHTHTHTQTHQKFNMIWIQGCPSRSGDIST